MNILEVNQVSKNYGNFVALDKVSLQVKEGAVFGLLGPNGAGKTSLIRIINQITAPDSGTIHFMGEPLSLKHVEQIGYLPEERGLYRKMKVGEQAIYLAMLKGLDKYTAVKRLKYWFEKFEIDAWWNKKVEELSKGMQQKIQFIVTIIHEPKFFIFDEPFSGFDPINANLLKEEMLHLKKHGASIIFSTHNMASVEQLCDDIALINKSKKVLDGNIRTIKNTYKKNIFELAYKSQNIDILQILQPDFLCLSVDKQNNDMSTIRVQLPQQFSSNDLLQMLLPHIQICSFQEILPSVEEIFISAISNPNIENMASL